MKSMLLILLVIAAIIGLVGLNSFLGNYIFKKGIKVKTRVICGFLLVVVNLVIFLWLDGVIGKIMFLFPFILLGPTYLVYRTNKTKG